MERPCDLTFDIYWWFLWALVFAFDTTKAIYTGYFIFYRPIWRDINY
jgi:hypothetical protein